MRAILACLAFSLALPFSAAASGDGDLAETDDIVRLPGQQAAARPDKMPLPGTDTDKPQRLVPGGVLIVSFDTNGDGIISQEELRAGISAAFTQADANGDGQISALEQQAWAASFPVRDDTLANPVRFDPNLDRVVTYEEFYTVVLQLAASYQDSAGNIAVAGLTAPDKPEKEDRRFAQGGMPRGEPAPGGPQR